MIRSAKSAGCLPKFLINAPVSGVLEYGSIRAVNSTASGPGALQAVRSLGLEFNPNSGLNEVPHGFLRNVLVYVVAWRFRHSGPQ